MALFNNYGAPVGYGQPAAKRKQSALMEALAAPSLFGGDEDEELKRMRARITPDPPSVPEPMNPVPNPGKKYNAGGLPGPGSPAIDEGLDPKGYDEGQLPDPDRRRNPSSATNVYSSVQPPATWYGPKEDDPTTPSGGGDTYPTDGTTTSGGGGGGGGVGGNFSGFNFNRAQDPSTSAKDAFAQLASANPPTEWTKEGAESWFRSSIAPGLEALGYKIYDVKGDKVRIGTRENPGGEWVDFMINAGGDPNREPPSLAWQSEMAKGSGVSGGGSAATGGVGGGTLSGGTSPTSYSADANWMQSGYSMDPFTANVLNGMPQARSFLDLMVSQLASGDFLKQYFGSGNQTGGQYVSPDALASLFGKIRGVYKA